MSADANLPANAFDGGPFDDFYDRALPVVFGYLLRLWGGDREEAARTLARTSTSARLWSA